MLTSPNEIDPFQRLLGIVNSPVRQVTAHLMTHCLSFLQLHLRLQPVVEVSPVDGPALEVAVVCAQTDVVLGRLVRGRFELPGWWRGSEILPRIRALRKISGRFLARDLVGRFLTGIVPRPGLEVGGRRFAGGTTFALDGELFLSIPCPLKEKMTLPNGDRRENGQGPPVGRSLLTHAFVTAELALQTVRQYCTFA